MNGKVGEVRVTGSIAYELAMTARGVLQYAVTTGPHLWDVAGGVVLVAEAGGLIMSRRRSDRLGGLIPETRWEPMESFVSTWDTSVPTMKGAAPLVHVDGAGQPGRRPLRHLEPAAADAASPPPAARVAGMAGEKKPHSPLAGRRRLLCWRWASVK